MNKPVHISSNSKINYDIEMYMKPEEIYVPLENKSGIKYKHLVKEGDYIYKGGIVAINEDLNFPIHSSVSGYAAFGSTKLISNGKEIKCVVVKNDFKEKYVHKRYFQRIIPNKFYNTKNTFAKSDFLSKNWKHRYAETHARGNKYVWIPV